MSRGDVRGTTHREHSIIQSPGLLSQILFLSRSIIKIIENMDSKPAGPRVKSRRQRVAMPLIVKCHLSLSIAKVSEAHRNFSAVWKLSLDDWLSGDNSHYLIGFGGNLNIIIIII